MRHINDRLFTQRRLRSAAWPAGFGLLFLALSVLSLRVNPLKSFLTYTFARISSRATFAFLDDTPLNILTNMAPFGPSFKLQLFGLDVGAPWRIARRIGRFYSIALAILAVVAARHPSAPRKQAVI